MNPLRVRLSVVSLAPITGAVRVTLLVLTTHLQCQTEHVPQGQPRRPPDHGATDFHRRPERPSPREVMTWLQQAAGAAAAARATAPSATKRATTPPSRPAGAGRWVVAVLVDAELDFDAEAVLGVARKDVLLLASPGPTIRPEELALLEHAVREERLALCVVVVRDGDTSRSADGDSPAARALARRLQAAHDSAEPAGTSRAVRHAVLQANVVTSAADSMRLAAQEGRLRASVAVLPARGRDLRWIAPWFDRPLPHEVFAELRADDATTDDPGPQPEPRSGPPVRYPPPPARRH